MGSRTLPISEVTKRLQIKGWPLVFTYEDSWYPGFQQLTLHEDGHVEFLNEKGCNSGKHGQFCFYEDAGECDYSGSLYLKVVFHCTGSWGIEAGWGRTVQFKVPLALWYESDDVRPWLPCLCRPFQDRVRMQPQVGPKRSAPWLPSESPPKAQRLA